MATAAWIIWQLFILLGDMAKRQGPDNVLWQVVALSKSAISLTRRAFAESASQIRHARPHIDAFEARMLQLAAKMVELLLNSCVNYSLTSVKQTDAIAPSSLHCRREVPSLLTTLGCVFPKLGHFLGT